MKKLIEDPDQAKKDVSIIMEAATTVVNSIIGLVGSVSKIVEKKEDTE